MARVCVSENLGVVNSDLVMKPWSVPRLVADNVAQSGGDGTVFPQLTLPGKLMIDLQASWTNDAPIDQSVLLRVTRASREWVTSNPNAIQIRDRWSYAFDRTPDVPVTTGVYNSQVGSAIDLGTNTVAEPVTGRMWGSQDAHSSDEWVPQLLAPGQTINVWYRCYLWTPPPWSDNANRSSPEHSASVKWARLQIMSFPQQGSVVAG